MAAHEEGGGKPKEFELIVDKQLKTWPNQMINGSQIKGLAGSPSDWVVNQIVPGPGTDPEIGDGQDVDLDKNAAPKGEKRFTTRKPATSPG